MTQIMEYIIFGLVSGLSHFLPLSASANSQFLANVLGRDQCPALIQVFACSGCLAALLLRCGKQLSHIRREQHIASLPAKRKKRQPDAIALRDSKVMRSAMAPLVACTVVSWLLLEQRMHPLIPILLLSFTGILVYMPQFFPGGDRSSRSMEPLDGFLWGLCSGISLIPGFSSMGAMISVGQLRLCDRKYTVDMALLISIPAMLLMLLLYIIAALAAGLEGFSLTGLAGGLLCAAAAFAGSCGSISLVRYLAVRLGFHAFAYFVWGFAMLQFILYLLT